jgi:lipopolysaccharide export system permease protein
VRILTRYILKEHLGPFVFSMAVLTFLFLMQHLIEILELVIGKGLQVSVVIELFILNLAWMIALTVPMAVLVAVLMAFGRLSHDGEITALRASGISAYRLLVPVLIASVLIAACLVYFNDRILPEFNYRAKTLTMDIRVKRPTLALRAGVFVESIPGYTIHLDRVDPFSSRVEGVTIVQYLNFAAPNPPRVIRAEWGTMQFDEAGETLDLDLRSGTITEIHAGESRVQDFSKFKTFLVVEGTTLERSESGVRGDRELSIADMKLRVADRDSQATLRANELVSMPATFVSRIVGGEAIDLPDRGRGLRARGRTLAAHKALIQHLESRERSMGFYLRQASRYRVEIYKKWSIPFACIAFVLIGVPLGVMVRRSGAVLGFGIALSFFLLYWSCLILGEDLADRRIVEPWLAMWLPNILVTSAGILMLLRGVYVRRVIRWDLLAGKIPGKVGNRLAARILAGNTRQ